MQRLLAVKARVSRAALPVQKIAPTSSSSTHYPPRRTMAPPWTLASWALDRAVATLLAVGGHDTIAALNLAEHQHVPP
jgi:hypothetical protein